MDKHINFQNDNEFLKMMFYNEKYEYHNDQNNLQ